MGIRQLHTNSTKTYHTSKSITKPLTKEIINQSYYLPNEEDVKSARTTTMTKVKKEQGEWTEKVKAAQPSDIQRKTRSVI